MDMWVERRLFMHQVVGELRDAAAAFPDWQRPRFHDPATASALAALADAVGAPLPAALDRFLRITDAIVAMDVRNGYWVGGTAELIRSVQRGDHPTSVVVGRSTERVVPVATDGGGNAFLATVDGGAIWRWAHEVDGAERIAPTFETFLRRIAEDWRRAVVGDTGWTYLV